MSKIYRTIYGFAVTKLEREWLHDTAAGIATQFTKPVIVNIGVAHGATMHCLRAGAPTARLFGVDIDYKSNPIKRKADLKATFIEGNSHVCHVDFRRVIHFLFIDGDHHYPAVKADIAGWVPKVIQGGIIAFHDYSPAAPDLRSTPFLAGVKKAVGEWMTRENTHWKSLDTPNSICAFRRIS